MKIKIKELSTYRSALMGLAILYVFLFHTITDWAPTWGYKIVSNGDNGVDMFLFLSGIGLMYSMKNNPNVLAFYKRRLFRIFPTYWVTISFIYIVVIFLIKVFHAPEGYLNYPHNIIEFILSYTTLGYWIDGNNYNSWYDWYIPAIVSLYLFFPLLFKLLEKSRWFVICCLIPIVLSELGLISMEWYHLLLYYRIGTFILGCAFFYLLDTEVSGLKAWLILIVGVLGMFIYAYTDILNSVAFFYYPIFWIVMICAMLTFCQLFKMNKYIDKTLSFFGVFSLELYLVHTQINRMVVTVSTHIIPLNNWMIVLATFVISLSIALSINKLCNMLTRINTKIHKSS